jgi:hypothetical protein
MASVGERPDLDALRELEEVLRHFENELASWRRRALTAEARLAELGSGPAAEGSAAREVEEENRVLQQRLGAVKGRVGDLLDRMRFLEEQQHPGGNGQ